MKQIKQIKKATKAFIIPLSLKTFAIYLDIPNRELVALFKYNEDTLLPYQRYNKRNQNKSRYFFQVNGTGINHARELGDMLRKHNPDIKVLKLTNGFDPYLV